MASEAITLKAMRAQDAARVAPRIGVRVAIAFVVAQVLLLGVLAIGFASGAGAQPIRGEVAVNTNGGYARLAFNLAKETEAEVRLAGAILIISFKSPVDVSVDKLPTGAPAYIGAARRDPDGSAIRIGLARKVTVNLMAAGERLFVDLLPDTWTGLPPGLPQEVVDDLARRAREAEKKLHAQRALEQLRQKPPIKVRVGTQPTFTRYVFELPEFVAVATERGKDALSIVFDSRLRFDLTDAKANLPPMIATIDAEAGEDTSTVRFNLMGRVDARSFREDSNFIVDVVAAEGKPAAQERAALAKPTELAAVAPVPAESAAPPPPASIASPVPASAASPPAPSQPAASPPAAEAAASRPPLPSQPTAHVPYPPPRPASAPQAKRGREPAPTVATAPPPPPSPPAAPAQAAVPPAEPAGVDRPADMPAPAAGAAVAAEPPKAEAPAAAKPSAQAALPPPADLGGDVAPVASRDPKAAVVAELRHKGEALKLTFPFATPTPAAVFRRVDALWLVFDTTAPIDLGKLDGELSKTLRSVTTTRTGEATVVRIKLERPRLASLSAEGLAWAVTLGDMVLDPTRPLTVTRNMASAAKPMLEIPFEDPHKVHHLTDPEIGDGLVVVTALAPARGFLKAQDFVEFRALASIQGVAIQPLADDVDVALTPDRIIIGRPEGLVLSLDGSVAGRAGRAAGSVSAATFEPQNWSYDRQADYLVRQAQLVRDAAEAPEAKRTAARLDVARFFLARDMYQEAKGVLDVALATDRKDTEVPAALMLRAAAHVLMGRSDLALKDVADPRANGQPDAPLWRALAFVRQSRWPEAREAFKAGDAAVAGLPVELQRIVRKEAIRAAIEVKDFADANRTLNDMEAVGVPREQAPAFSVLSGRVAEGLGRLSDALTIYRSAAESWDRPSAVQGKLREVSLRYALKDLGRKQAIGELETLTAIWRGDETEIEALQMLARLYTDEGRYRDAFYVMRTAMTAHPNSETTRKIQDDAAATFDALFLDGKGDSMSAIEALSLFYDFRELTPVGRRGDEMIRRLAERLVSVDLLDQASDLLQHQVDHRLQGAARAQIASRLAVVYLMNRKPDRALQALRSSRTADLSNELRNQRLLIEARALSEVGRHDVALEVTAGLSGREVARLRADIQWSAKRWREAGESIENLYAGRWNDFASLDPAERADILRAAVAYTLAEDTIGLDRFRQKFAAKFADGPDRRMFDVLTAPLGARGPEFDEIAKAASSVDTLSSFLRDLRARYPETGGAAPTPAKPAEPPAPPATLPNAAEPARPGTAKTASR